jgi:hypothetical protein
MTKSNSAHSCYGTGIGGCNKIENPYHYGDLDPVKLQALRQEQVDLWLKQGTWYDPNVIVNPVNGILPKPIYFQKNSVWPINTIIVPTPALSEINRGVNQLRSLQQQWPGTK